MTLSGKPLTLQDEKRNTTVRYVVNPRGVLSIQVFRRALSGASRRQDFESAPLFFCLFGLALSVKTRGGRINGENQRNKVH